MSLWPYHAVVTADARRPASRSRGTWWIGVSLALLTLASETKFVLKDDVAASGSRVDIYILVEVAVYAGVAAYVVLRHLPPPSLAGMHWLDVLLLGYVLIMALSVPLSPSPIYAAVRVFEMAVALAILRCAAHEPNLRWFRQAAAIFVTATCAMVAVGVVAPSSRPPLQVERFNWLATHSVVVGQFLSLALVLSAVLAIATQWREDAGPRRLAYWTATAVCAVALAANNTRGSAAAAAAGLVVGVSLILPRRLWASGLLLMAYASALIALTSLSTIGEWITRGESSQALGTLNSRLPYWALQVEAIASDSPIFGFGLGASRSIFLDETGLGGSHNAVLNVLVDTGVLGLSVWLAMLTAATWFVVRWRGDVPRVERSLWISTLVVLAVNGVTAEGLGGVANAGAIWMMILTTMAARVAQNPAAEADGVAAMRPTRGGRVAV
jgi:O-antigen ligase